MISAFTKMQALGNDFIIIDATRKRFKLPSKQIKKLSDRHFGIGFDQLLIIEKSRRKTADFNYRIFNADGSEVSQCGNGARALALYIYQKKLSTKRELTLATLTGKIVTRREKNNQISVNMGVPTLVPDEIPFVAEEMQIYYPLAFDLLETKISAVGLGNPHAVINVEDVNTAPVQEWGPIIEQHRRFPLRTNVGFMQIHNRRHISLRVFERGAGETLACGSGACAAVIAGRIQNKLDDKVRVDLPGGTLRITWKGEGSPVWMQGPAEFVFDGKLKT